MSFVQSLFAAFSMFSALPAPQLSWERENIRYMLVCLPFVGVVIGLLVGLLIGFVNARSCPPSGSPSFRCCSREASIWTDSWTPWTPSRVMLPRNGSGPY